MTTEPLTLTGFLLARIAEDEATAHSRGLTDIAVMRGGCRGIGCQRRAGTGHALGCPARALADCEAKRQTVALAVDGFEHNPNSTLRILAAVYADHPDYQEGWRG